MVNKFNKSYNDYPFRWIFFYAFISLLLGTGIYLFLRPSEPLFFDWLNKIGLRETINSLRLKSVLWHNFLPEWVVFSLPNGLWAFSYSVFIFFLWGNSTSHIKYFWLGTLPLVVFGFEILQFTGDIPGIFCWQDLIFLAVGMGSELLLGTKIIKNKNHEKKFT